MVRVLFWAVMLVAMLVLMTAGLIRWELAAPGVTGLFTGPDGAPDSGAYLRVVSAHGLFGALLMVLAGLWLGKMSARDGAAIHRVWIWPGLLVALALIAGIGWALFHTDATGWTLYPPLGDDPLGLGDALSLDPMLLSLGDVGVALGAAFLFLGIFARIGTRKGFRVWAALGALLVIALALFFAVIGDWSDAAETPLLHFLPLGFILAMLSIILIEEQPDWAAFLFIGAAAALAGATTFAAGLDDPFYADTMSATAISHMGASALTWFVIGAGLMTRFRPRNGEAFPWALGLAILAAGLLTFLPIWTAGQMGMPRGYIDFPDAMARANLAASLGALLLGLVLLAGLTVILRRRSAPARAEEE